MRWPWDPQGKHLQTTWTASHPELGELRLLRTPITLSAVEPPMTFHHAAPDAGKHTDEVLRDFGYDDARIQQLREAGMIA